MDHNRKVESTDRNKINKRDYSDDESEDSADNEDIHQLTDLDEYADKILKEKKEN